MSEAPFDLIAEIDNARERCRTMPIRQFECHPLDVVATDPLWQDPVFCEVMKVFEEKR